MDEIIEKKKRSIQKLQNEMIEDLKQGNFERKWNGLATVYSGCTTPAEESLPNLMTASRLSEVIEEEKACDWNSSLTYEEKGGLDPPEYIEKTRITDITREENIDKTNLLWEERCGLDTPAELAEIAAEKEAYEEDILLTYEEKGGLDPPEYIVKSATNNSRRETRDNHK